VYEYDSGGNGGSGGSNGSNGNGSSKEGQNTEMVSFTLPKSKAVSAEVLELAGKPGTYDRVSEVCM